MGTWRLRVPFVLGFCVALITVPFFWCALINPTVNGDISWQRWLGSLMLEGHGIPTHLGAETLSAPGGPWVAQEWLLAITLAVAQRLHAYWAVALAATAAAAATMLLCAERARRRGVGAPFYLALCASTVGIGVAESFGVRAQVFAWPFFALLLLALDSKRSWWSVPITVAWANVHASVVIAPVVAALYAAGAFVDDRSWSSRVRQYTLIALLLALATCATPLGVRLPIYALTLASSPIRSFIQEWQPIAPHDLAVWISFAGIVAGMAFIVWKRYRMPAPDILVLLACGYLAATSARNAAIFVIAAAPVVCIAVSRLAPMSISWTASRAEILIRTAMVIVALPLVFAVTVRSLEASYQKRGELIPFDAMSYVAGMAGQKRLFCFDFGTCSAALAYPDVKTFMDGRCDPFPWPVWVKYRAVMRAQPGWSKTLSAYNINVVLAPAWAPLTHAIARDATWKRAYHRGGYDIFVRTQT